jgi:phosphate transport system substrate-binding protein
MKNFILAAGVTLMATSAYARDNIQIAGSSTVLPYASIVAEAFGENFDYQTPVVESGGSSAGLKRFCTGVGENTIDIANASRAMKDSEKKYCAENGVSDITEVRIGYDGIVFAASHETPGFEELTPADIYKALHIDSQAQSWKDVNPSLPDTKIFAFIPGTKHGTREVFEDKVLVQGCEDVGDFKKFKKELGDKKAAKRKCISVRRDGRSVDIDGDYTETLASIEANKGGIGVFGLAFLLNNTDKIYAAKINSIEASVDTIASGEYPVSRPLYFYVKNAHLSVIPGLKEYVQFFVADEIAGPYGPLADYGLVSDPELAKTQKKVQ